MNMVKTAATPADPAGPLSATADSVAGTASRRRPQLAWVSRYGLLAVFVLIFAAFSIARPHSFPTWSNVQAMLIIAAPSLIVASALTVVLAMDDFDLSFASMISLAIGLAVILMAHDGVPWPLAALIAIAAGGAAGVLNGYLVSVLGGSSFVITLAVGTILTGVEFTITKQATIFQGIPSGFANFTQHNLLGLAPQVWISFVFAAVIWALLDRTEAGRYMYAIGGNREAARLAGIRVTLLRLAGFVIVGLGAALVGVLLGAQSAAYTPSAGAGYLLPAYAGVFLGSAVFRPGDFNLPGTIVGVLFLGMIQTGLTMLNLDTSIVNLVQGAILIGAVLLSRIGSQA